MHCSRRSVRGSDIVARIGGDEFVVALTNLGREQDVVVVAEKLRTGLDAPIAGNGETLKVSVSIGISMCPNDGTKIDVLIRKADDAMCQAKARGRDGCAFYGQAVNARVSERLHLEKSLRRAIEHGEFVLQFQPVTDLPRGRAIGVEALLRWEHPDLGLVFPSNFLPFAEKSGLIVPIGQWALEEACRRARILAEQGLGRLHVALNLSARHGGERRRSPAAHGRRSALPRRRGDGGDPHRTGRSQLGAQSAHPARTRCAVESRPLRYRRRLAAAATPLCTAEPEDRSTLHRPALAGSGLRARHHGDHRHGPDPGYPGHRRRGGDGRTARAASGTTL
ncbi:MAG TPA: EAL domain-containing protein [Gammaproteobacteria bacterium]|nr:EAL domain-containing protein [Chromatiales bacterium]HDK03022.1 EAL domain-containing protein [Gammaproteobacteria bacterium]HDO34079.1 EAL domain-containing protein [Chromatiales bacterium]